VALLVPERPHLGAAEQAIQSWRGALAATLDEIATALHRPKHELLDPDAQHSFIGSASDELRLLEDQSIDDVIAADQSVRFNVRAHEERHQVHDLADTVDWLQRVSLHVQAIALGFDELYDRAGPRPRLERATMAELAELLSAMLRSPADSAHRREASDQISATIDSALDAVTHGGPDLATVLESVSLLGRADQLRGELVGEVIDAPTATI
jgi:hypothetical protein